MDDVRVLIDGLSFPEGPRWHDGALWFSDFTAKTLYRVDEHGVRRAVVTIDDSPSGLGFLPDGTPLVVSMHRKLLLRLTPKGPEVHADLRDLPGDFLNDMVVDTDGRAYVGTRTRAMRPARAALGPEWEVDTIVAVEPSGECRVAADGLIAPNGTVISPDGSYLVVGETYGQRLARFERDPTDGSLRGHRVFADAPGTYPDGICLDEAGGVWFGSPYTDEFVRVVDGGEQTHRLALPGGVACALGGPSRSVLYLLGVDPSSLPSPDHPEAPLEARTTPATGGHIWVVPAPHAGAGLP